jgi:hypothetical protein
MRIYFGLGGDAGGFLDGLYLIAENRATMGFSQVSPISKSELTCTPVWQVLNY